MDKQKHMPRSIGEDLDLHTLKKVNITVEVIHDAITRGVDHIWRVMGSPCHGEETAINL